MRIASVLTAALLVVSPATWAATEPYLAVDQSSELLMDKKSALAIWKAQVDDGQRARLRRLYPVSKWGFISQVAGGFTPDMACVVTAHAIMVPRIPGGRLVFKPYKAAVTFGSQAGATREQCKEMAAAKLSEAIAALSTSLISQ